MLVSMAVIQPRIATLVNGGHRQYQANCRGFAGIIRAVASNQRLELDQVDRTILAELQRDGRVSIAGLARRACLSASSTADRLRRLVDGGVITGYTAVLAPQGLGYPITAFVRLRYQSGNYKPLHDLLGTTPEIIEAHHVTGDDCFILKLLARSMTDLERLAGKIAGLGSITTNVVYSSPLPRRELVPPS
jgi:Lrp/AsnC family transcriptional regulator, leucine-responsive regulatory protein